MLKKEKRDYQSVYNKFKNHRSTEGFELKNITEVFIPFWYCKQKIVVENFVEIDRFSKIILELIHSKIKTHKGICDFLGITESDFTTMQIHYLLKQELIEEHYEEGNIVYEITHQGISFLNDKKAKIQKIETVDFECFYNDLSKEYFNPKDQIDNNNRKNKSFSGYQITQTHKLMNNEVVQIPHKNRPILSKINQSDFAVFFNKQKGTSTFYDFEANSMQLHKRSIMFLQLEYENEENQIEIEIRQIKKSVIAYKGNVYEKKLSLDAMKYYQTK
ncbi:hypothetical protein [Flavicella sediminum]|uniref:hypothetical protein n=1 Tax=Flavicella sediminum TaxID=2585141 RepID=UPI00111D00BA|nr:hypothetical protein [Flavicella sediminum]